MQIRDEKFKTTVLSIYSFRWSSIHTDNSYTCVFSFVKIGRTLFGNFFVMSQEIFLCYIIIVFATYSNWSHMPLGYHFCTFFLRERRMKYLSGLYKYHLNIILHLHFSSTLWVTILPGWKTTKLHFIKLNSPLTTQTIQMECLVSIPSLHSNQAMNFL